MHRLRWLVIAVALAACHKDKTSSSSPGAPVSTAELDALWAKAPDKTMVGIVVSPRGITMMDHAWRDVHAFLKSIPEFAPAEQEMTAELGKLGLASDFQLADVGLGPAKGGAMFVDADDAHHLYTIIPVVDRDKFLAKAKGTKGTDVDKLDKTVCKTIDGFYACAETQELLARFGKGNVHGDLDAAKARGDIEVVATVDKVKAAGVVQLERGGFVARGVVAGVPSMFTSRFGAPHDVNVDLSHASGFATLDLRPFLDGVPEIPIIEGVTASDVVKSIGGPMNVMITSGDFGLDTRVPLSDTAPAKKLIEHCGDLPGALGAKLEGGNCHIPLPQVNVDATVSVDGKDLHLVAKGSGTPTAVSPSATGAELAKGKWSAAFWGRGTLLAPTPAAGAMPFGDIPGEAAMVIRTMIMLDELGLGVRIDGDKLEFVWTLRTGWANPDDVVAKLLAVDPSQVVAGKGAEIGKAIADAAPSSPFAADFKSGYGGLMVPTAIIGMMAAVAIPAFMEYMGPSKRRHGGPHAEAEIGVKKLAYEGYPMWAAAHPDKQCPDKIEDLDEYVDGGHVDPWGNPYVMMCGANLPPGAKGLAIQSAGPDGKLGTDDDVKSWDE